MSHEYYRRGRNWYTAIGSLFLIMAGIVLVRQVILWGPEFVEDFIVNSEFTNEKTGELSYLAEISTPLLLNAMIRNKIKNPGIKII